MRLIRLLKRDLATEISTWVERELVTADQARAIGALYGIDYDADRSRSTGYRVLVVLGFLFIGLALITLIGANWEEIPRAARMAGLVALTAGTHALALRSHLPGRTAMGTGLFFLGNLFYGASIILVAQIYHLGEHMPDGVFWWALGTLPFGVLLRNPWLTLQTGLLALIWLHLEHTTGLLNAAAFLSLAFPVFLAAEFYVLTRARANVPLFLTFVASLFLWVQNSLATMWWDGDHHFEWSEENVFVGAALFLLAYAAGCWLHARGGAKTKDYGTVLSVWTVRLVLVGMLVLSFENFWLELLRDDWSSQGWMWVAAGALAAAALWLGARAGALRTLLAPTVLAAGTMIAVVVVATRSGAHGAEEYAAWFQVLDNAALVAAGIWLIVRGAAAGVSHWFFLGVGVILLTAFLRYMDLIGDYVGGAALFLAFAGVLLGSARYWKHRQSREVRA